MKRVLPAAALLLLLDACSVGGLLAPSGAPARLYTLSAPATIATDGPRAGWQLLIGMPDAQMDINQVQIAVTPDSTRIDYYKEVAWADRPSAMLQALILQSFDRSGRIAAVERQSGNLKSDFQLNADIENFEVDAGAAAPAAHVRLTLKLVRSRDRTIVATRTFDVAKPAGPTFDGAIAAFNAGLAELLPQIVDWTLTQGNANP